jgi:DNA-binding NarL/FixJ family response regulator
VRVVIVSECALGAESIRWCFKYASNLEVIGYLDGRRPCAPGVRSSGADMVVFDDMKSRADLLDRIAELREAMPTTKLVLLTRTMDSAALDEASRAGIDAAISRDIDPASLGMLVRQIGRGAVFHSFARPAAAVARTDPRADQLTAREWEILQLVAHGNSNSRVAAKLWVTEQTVKFHLSNIYRKLGVANRTEASHYAHLNGLLDPLPPATPAPTTAPVTNAVAA